MSDDDLEVIVERSAGLDVHKDVVAVTVRVPSAAVRARRPTASTPGSPCRNRRSATAELVTSIAAASREVAASPGERSVGMNTDYLPA